MMDFLTQKINKGKIGHLVKYLSIFFVSLAMWAGLSSVIGQSFLPQQAQSQIPVQSQPSVQPLAQPKVIRGVWMTNNDLDVLRDRAKLKAALTKLKELNFNTIYPVVWNSGYAFYPSATAKQAGIQPFVYKGTAGQDILEDVITQSHSLGLRVIPWFEFGFMAPPTSELAINKAEWLTQRRDSTLTSISADGEVVWLNPFRPEVQDFISNLVMEVVSQYDVDGIQFDDHTSLPKEFGYDRFTVDLYKKGDLVRECKPQVSPSPKPSKSSKPAQTKPEKLPPICTTRRVPQGEPPRNVENPGWVRWRADKITEFMVKLSKTVKAKKSDLVFSISPNYLDFAYKEQLQDWNDWVKKGVADEIIMQAYRSDLKGFTSLIERPEILETQKRIPTGVAILTGLRSSPAPMSQIQPQVQAAQQRNLGISFFYFNSLWDYGPEPIAERQSRLRSFFASTAR
jgi:uncharacterized lipoprotein YddW (UPF0748 family)